MKFGPSIRGAVLPQVSAASLLWCSPGIAGNILVNAGCTLNEAIISANSPTGTNEPGCAGASIGPDVILLPAGAQTLTTVEDTSYGSTGLRTITSNITIKPSGAGTVIIQRSNNASTPAFRLFRVANTGNLTLEHITLNRGLADGSALAMDGGAILTSGATTLRHCTVSGNSATDTAGAISNSGSLVVSDSTLSGNNADGSGGAIFNFSAGTVELIDVTISDNVSGANGGGLSNLSGSITLTNSTVSNNLANKGGGLWMGGSGLEKISVINSMVNANSAGFRGGGVYIRGGTVSLTSSTLSGNISSGDGGGAHTRASLMLTNSTISANTGVKGGGIMVFSGSIIIDSSAVTDNTGTSHGGGLYIDSVFNNSITHSTFSGNSALAGVAGAIYNKKSSLSVANSTISANSASFSGGGIYNGFNSHMSLTNVTLSGNSSPLVGGLAVGFGTVTLGNSIIANSSGSDCSINAATLINAGVNLIEDGSCSASLSGDPKLGALSNNGGPTLTHELLRNSPAIDAGDDAICPATDQRGVQRPDGLHCDIGAYEVETTTFFVVPTPGGKTVIFGL